MTPYLTQPARIVERRIERRGHLHLRHATSSTRRPAAPTASRRASSTCSTPTASARCRSRSSPIRTSPPGWSTPIRLAGRVTDASWPAGRSATSSACAARTAAAGRWTTARGRDVVVVTGGLGCAPVVGVINYIFRRRDQYGTLHILHGVKTPNDLLYRERFDAWRLNPRTSVYLTADQPGQELALSGRRGDQPLRRARRRPRLPSS